LLLEVTISIFIFVELHIPISKGINKNRSLYQRSLIFEAAFVHNESDKYSLLERYGSDELCFFLDLLPSDYPEVRIAGDGGVSSTMDFHQNAAGPWGLRNDEHSNSNLWIINGAIFAPGANILQQISVKIMVSHSLLLRYDRLQDGGMTKRRHEIFKNEYPPQNSKGLNKTASYLVFGSSELKKISILKVCF